MKRTYSTAEAEDIAQALSIDFSTRPFDLEQFRAGLDVEAEHGAAAPERNVTNDDPVATGKIALAHLNEIPDYYTRLKAMEAEAKPAAKGSEKRQGPLSRFMPFVLTAVAFLAVRAWVKGRAARKEPVKEGSEVNR